MYYDEHKNIPEWYGRTLFEASMAFLLFENYVNNTISQWERIKEDRKAFPTKSVEEQKTLMRNLFLDIHSYFVFYTMAQKYFECLEELEKEQKMTNLWLKFKPKFKPFVDARNHMEHPCCRIKEWKYLRDWCNIRGDKITIGGEAFDLGKSGLKILTDAYEEVFQALRSKPNQ